MANIPQNSLPLELFILKRLSQEASLQGNLIIFSLLQNCISLGFLPPDLSRQGETNLLTWVNAERVLDGVASHACNSAGDSMHVGKKLHGT